MGSENILYNVFNSNSGLRNLKIGSCDLIAKNALILCMETVRSMPHRGFSLYGKVSAAQLAFTRLLFSSVERVHIVMFQHMRTVLSKRFP